MRGEDAAEQGRLPGMEPEVEMEGIVERIVFASENGRFAVFQLRPLRQHGRISVTAGASPPLVGQQVFLKGRWAVHPKFGRQFQASHLRASAPSSAEGIERFLASGAIDGIGEVMAHRIVEKFGAEALDIMEKQPSRLTEVDGIGKKTAEKIAASLQKQSELREIMIWLETRGISGIFAGRIFKQYGSFAIEVLEKKPYQLARDIEGIGFVTADAIAAANGLEKDSVPRIEAGIDHALAQIASSGHCCLPEGALTERAAALLGLPGEQVRDVMRSQLAAGRLVSEDMGGETLVYPPFLYHAERRTAERLLELQRTAHSISAEAPEQMAGDWEDAHGLHLAKGQRDAMLAALQQGVFILTGGPGTGKTTVVRGMLELLEQQGLAVLLGAPTGRAAKRLAEATEHKAVTIHRMLEAQGGREEAAFARDASEPLEADAIILDEVSMMDIVLTQHFLEAVPDGCHLILVGDADQLPAVGPGSVLRDLLRSSVIPSVKLTEIFRQEEAGAIVTNAHAIHGGRVPECRPRGDFQFIEAKDAREAEDIIVELCAKTLPAEGFSPWTDVQVLSPMHRQECGVDSLNRRLQAALNPKDPAKAEFANSAMALRLGDKVMQTKNDYEKHVFNGDIGFLVELAPNCVTVRYGESQQAAYERNELGELQLAYAMSVHKSQGSEYPVVILPLVPGHRIMLQRNLLYTAVTRAKRRVILVGARAALHTAVANDRMRRRYTLLSERLNGGLAVHA